jgi:lysophospholipase L1-like esterase
LRPDFVVVMENVNDRGILGRYGTYWNDDKSQSVVTAPRASVEDGLRQIRDALIPRTYRALKRLMDSARAEFDAPPAPRSRLSADEYKRALRTLVRVAKTWDIRPVLLTQVMLSEEQGGRGTGRADDYLAAERLSAAGVDPAAQERDHARFNDVVRRVAAEEGALLIDLAADPGWRAEHFYDRLHFTDSGSIRAADIVASRLLAILEEEPGRP